MCVHACVFLSGKYRDTRESCVYVAHSLRAAIGRFKEEKQKNGNSCRYRRNFFYDLIVDALVVHVRICNSKPKKNKKHKTVTLFFDNC